MITFNTSPLQASELLSFYHIHFKRTKNIAIIYSKNLLWRLHSTIHPYKQANDYSFIRFLLQSRCLHPDLQTMHLLLYPVYRSLPER